MPGAIDSTTRLTMIAVPASAVSQRCQPPMRTTNATATIDPQTYDGADASDSTENRPMPISDPTRSQRYAVSGGS
jgi:hypothetical protein